MARAHFVKAARKDYPKHDIKKGESYYWWKFMVGGRGGPKHFSKTAPRRSQLTQSEFLSQLYDIEDNLSEAKADDSLPSMIDDAVAALNELADEQESKRESMPDSLQSGATGELLEERADACRTAADALDQIDTDADNREEGTSEEEWWSSVLEEVQAVSIDAS